jgi:hypothetical protein
MFCIFLPSLRCTVLLQVTSDALAHQGYDLQLTRYDEKGWRADVLYNRDGALADERHRIRLGADAVVGGSGCGARHPAKG